MQRRRSEAMLLCIVAVAALAFVLSAQGGSEVRQPIAWLGKEAIYEEDLNPSVGGQLLQLKVQAYELKIQALNDLVNQRLLDGDAKSKGITSGAVLEEVVRDLPSWQFAELQGYYLAQKDHSRPLEEVRPQIERSFIQARQQQARQVYIDRLREKAGFTIALSRPRAEVSVDLTRVKGNREAPVTIVEFGDFECPYCAEAAKTLKILLDKYKEKLRIGYRDFPVRQIHERAQLAAEASRCAAEQGKFWEYHDLLFARQERLDRESLYERALKVGMVREQYDSCIAGRKYQSSVESDLQLGTASGVSGTPGFLINGIVLTGSQPLSTFEKIIDSELAATAGGRTVPGTQSADRSRLP